MGVAIVFPADNSTTGRERLYYFLRILYTLYPSPLRTNQGTQAALEEEDEEEETGEGEGKKLSQDEGEAEAEEEEGEGTRTLPDVARQVLHAIGRDLGSCSWLAGVCSQFAPDWPHSKGGLEQVIAHAGYQAFLRFLREGVL